MNLGLFDADHVSFIACYNKVNEPEKTLDEVYNNVDSYINRIFREINLDYYIGFLTIGRNFRYNINPEYKANRKDGPKIPFIKESKDYMIEKWSFIFHTDLEADDLIGIYNKYYSIKDSDRINYNTIIISPDKDLLTLQGNIYNPKSKESRYMSEKESNNKLFCQMITGDTVDGIKGLNKKGIKFAEKILTDNDITNFVKGFEFYLLEHGREKGIEEFYKNYKCLKILTEYHNELNPVRFIEPLEYKKIYEF